LRTPVFLLVKDSLIVLSHPLSKESRCLQTLTCLERRFRSTCAREHFEWSVTQARQTTYYIWRTRGDEKVRASHATNEWKTSAWDNPPPTGHPGEDFGCRCTTEPYQPVTDEYLEIRLSDVFDNGAAWDSRDFVRHYYRGRGRRAAVRETGHPTDVVARYMQLVEERLKRQILEQARDVRNGSFSDDFVRTYNLIGVVFPLEIPPLAVVFPVRCRKTPGCS